MASAQPPRTVYLLPMSGGLDQYLAAQLTREHVLQVVADPKLADAVMTDHLGEAFEQTMAKIHPRDEDEEAPENEHRPFHASGSRGTLFLVDTKSRHVIWSDFAKPPVTLNAVTLSKQAAKIVKRYQGAGTK